ncbi:hypothetical protein [Oceanibacterium hippocampi]|uniref:DUF1127 domain-containing protein n=1 Tax=Oceanibacterium hippocampi TaxID=745714 RepID=A0A1Y5SWY5_9PROT|nr:hypothetical protein [Oceanibacterium hippocampi]SLN46946.1 hypothetical protein OCH7691_02016 [Oceanibacterium hippocampi]
MVTILLSMFGRWRAAIRRHRAERELRFFEFDDYLLRDIGLRRTRPEVERRL